MTSPIFIPHPTSHWGTVVIHFSSQKASCSYPRAHLVEGFDIAYIHSFKVGCWPVHHVEQEQIKMPALANWLVGGPWATPVAWDKHGILPQNRHRVLPVEGGGASTYTTLGHAIIQVFQHQ